MGDSGALLLGFVLATIPLQGLLKTASIVTLFFPLLVLAVPILDTSFVVAKRLKYRQPVYAADRQHLHHRFVNIGFSQRRAATYIWLWCGTLAATALALRFIRPSPARGVASVAHPDRLGDRRGRPRRLGLHGLPARDREAGEPDSEETRGAGSVPRAEKRLVPLQGHCTKSGQFWASEAACRCYKRWYAHGGWSPRPAARSSPPGREVC